MATAITRTKKFKALVAALGSEEAAMVAYQAAEGVEETPAPKADPVKQLMAAGFTKEQAERALASQAQAAPAEAPLTSKERGEALVAQQGLAFTKGRVYGQGALAEALVRVLKTGKPEIVQSSGVGRTKAVLVYKEESGDAAIQNLTQPA